MMFGKKRITFEKFLSGIPASDYIFQKAPYEEQILWWRMVQGEFC